MILLGPPGCGKGTQGKLLSEHYKVVHLSTGEILREQVSLGTDLGVKAKAVMSKGELVSDDLINEVVKVRLSKADCDNGFILDGYPRTTVQAKALESFLGQKNKMIPVAIYLKIPDEEIIKRLTGRQEQEGRRDDSDVIIKHRLGVYDRETVPIFDYYREHNVFHKVSGLGEVEEVFGRLKEVIDTCQVQP